MKGESGIILLEVLLCVILISVGIVVVYQPLISSMQALHYAETRADAENYVMQEINKIRKYADISKKMPEVGGTKRIKINDRNADYRLQITPVSPDRKLVEVKHEVSWKFGGRIKRFHKTLFLYVPYEASL